MINSKLPVVLFLSTHNASSSQIAEALLRHKAGDQFEIYSMGLEPAEFSPLAKQVLDENGVSYAGQVAKDVTPYLGKLNVRYLFTVSEKAAQRGPTVFPGAIYYYNWDLPDPDEGGGSNEERLLRYRELLDRISQLLETWLEEFRLKQSQASQQRSG
jgi:protein-tyrosine-phosphatase